MYTCVTGDAIILSDWSDTCQVHISSVLFLSTRMEFWPPVAVKAIADFVNHKPALGDSVLAEELARRGWSFCFSCWWVL